MAGDDRRSRRPRRRASAVLALALALPLVVGGGASAQVGATTRVSVGSGDPGAQADAPSVDASISADGRYTAFTSESDLGRGTPGTAFRRTTALTLDEGENDLGSAVIDPAGEFAYAGTATTDPGRVVKVRLATMERVGAITLEPGEVELASSVMDPAGEFAYFGTRTGPGQIVKIDLGTFERVGAIVLEEGESLLDTASIDPAGRFAYFGTFTDTGMAVKIDLATFERVGALSFDGEVDSAVVDPAGRFGYFVLATGTVAKVDLASFEQVDALVLEEGERRLESAVIEPAGRFAYVATNTSPGLVVKIDLATFERVGAVNAAPRLASALMDPGGRFAYFGTQTSPGRVVRLDLSDFESVDAVVLEEGEDELLSAVIDPTGTVAHFATFAAAPGQVVEVALAGEGEPEGRDVFVRDRQTHTTTLVSVRERCVLVGEFDVCPPGGDAFEPSISADGRHVAFTSTAGNLQVSEPVDNRPLDTRQVYVADLEERTIRLASRDSIFNLDPGAGHSDQPSISGNGGLVAFRSFSRLTEDTPFGGHSEIFVRDLAVDETTLVSVHVDCLPPPEEENDSGPPSTVPGLAAVPGFQSAQVVSCGGDSRQPSVSADGRSVAFASQAQDLPVIPAMVDAPFHEHIFVRDRVAHTTILVTRDPATGLPAQGWSTEPSTSQDGRFIAFTTTAGFAPAIPGCAFVSEEGCLDVVVWDRDAPPGDRFVLASVTLAGGRSEGSFAPSITGDGGSVAFASFAANLVDSEAPGECPSCTHVYVRDLVAGETQVVSVDSDAVPGEGDSDRPSLSGDGSAVAFDSEAPLVGEDTNDVEDVFVHDLGFAEATVVPTALDFGEELIGTTSAPRVVTVTSTGTAPLQPSTTTIAGTHPGDFAVVADTCGVTLEPEQACAIAVVFSPVVVGERFATLQIANNAADSPQEVSLRGVGTAPALEVNPGEVDFGGLPVGETSPPSAVTAISVGSGPVDIAGVTISGGQAGDFGVVADGCSATTLVPTAACVVLVEFTPTDLGIRTTTLTVPSSAPDSPHTVRLVGEGLGGALVLSPDPVDFGAVAVAGGSAVRVATGTNVGVAPLTVGAVSVAGTDPGAFTIVDDTCSGAALAPLAGCTVTLRFVPPGLGLFEADLLAPHSASAGPASTRLRGVGVVTPGPLGPDGPGSGGPRLAISPDVVEFGRVVAGGDGDALTTTLTVTSVGTVPARVTEVVTEGPQSPEFGIVADACSQTTLVVGASCEVTVAFTPVASGPHAADLIARGEAVEPVSAALRGTGMVPTLTLDPPLGRRGFVTTATGSDFPPDVTVRLTWEPGLGLVLVPTDSDGGFEVTLLVLRRELVGPRSLVATTPDLRVVADYLVVPGRQVPPDFTNRY